mgnify:CR=1 FL=1
MKKFSYQRYFEDELKDAIDGSNKIVENKVEDKEKIAEDKQCVKFVDKIVIDFDI